MTGKKEQISASIDPDIIQAVELIAKEKNRSFSFIINELLRDNLIQQQKIKNE